MENQINIPLEQTKPYKCTQVVALIGGGTCGSEQFSQVYFLREIPALISPTMRKEIAPVPVFKCIKCGAIADLNQKLP